MANKRIYYAIQQVQIGTGAAKDAVHGLQTVGVTTNFNLEQVFEMGQLAIYQNIEEVPDIEVTLNKILDGYPLIYTMATENGTALSATAVATGPDLAGRQNARADVELSIFPDSGQSATGNTITGCSSVMCSGMYVSSVSYTFGVDGNFTEDVTLVGNEKVWTTGATAKGNVFTTNSDVPAAASKVGRRQHLLIPNCVFPNEIPGVGGTTSGKLDDNSATGEGWSTHFQTITVSCDMGREQINELGRRGPYTRYVTFPVEVTCEFEVLATEGDCISATEKGIYGGTNACDYRYNLTDNRIYLETCEGTKISLGNFNKLSSVNYTGGDTGGGNVTVTYSYSTFNDFAVSHTASATGFDASTF